REVALDRLLDAELSARRLSVTEEDVAAERRVLLEAFVRDAGASAADAERLLERLRRARGLGGVRFAGLLERDARRRRVVPADGVSLASAAEGIRGEVRRRRERVAMDDLGRRLLAKASLSALDRDLDWSLKGGVPEP